MASLLLYKEGDATREAFRVESSTLHIERNGLSLKPVVTPPQGLLVGTLELLLADSPIIIPKRFFTIRVDGEARVVRVPVEEIEDVYRDYHTGNEANKFLAALIDQTNGVIHSLSGGPIWRRYERFSRAFYDAMLRMEQLNRQLELKQLEVLMQEFNNYHLIRYGRFHFGTPLPPQVTVESSKRDSVLRKEKGEVLCSEGESFNGLYILLQGAVIIQKGKRVLGTIEKEGEAFGELSLFLEDKRTASVIAKERSSFLYVTKDQLPTFHQQHPLLFYELARTLSRRVRNNLEEIEEVRWITSQASEILLKSEKDQFIKKLQGFLRTLEDGEISEVVGALVHSLLEFR